MTSTYLKKTNQMVDFHNIQQLPILDGSYEDFSVPILVFDEKNPSFCEIGQYYYIYLITNGKCLILT
jgi:hypothetical protein